MLADRSVTKACRRKIAVDEKAQYSLKLVLIHMYTFKADVIKTIYPNPNPKPSPNIKNNTLPIK